MASSMINALSGARSLLFVPGNRAERFEKALASGADAIVLDLEDAVPLDEKAGAREAIARLSRQIAQAPVPVLIRINEMESEAGREDLRWLSSQHAPHGVMVPKAYAPTLLKALHTQHPQFPVIALVETAQGLANVNEIAAVPGVLRLAVGHIDFMADLGLQCSEDEPELAPLRFGVALASRLNGLASPIDGVTISFRDDAMLARDARRMLRYGFGGKLCIHPRQIAVLHQAMQPTDEEVSWAERVIEANADARGRAVQLGSSS